MAGSIDDIKVDRGEDGRLLASGWHGYACPNCGCYHIELVDDDNRVFAAMAIEDDTLVELAEMLLKFAKHLALVESGKPN
jgi:hypothetical protein